MDLKVNTLSFRIWSTEQRKISSERLLRGLLAITFFMRKEEKMIREIENCMKSHGWNDSASILVGLSGGADSVALTHSLNALSKKYGFRLYAAHVHHGLRGETADRDENFSKCFAESLGIRFFSLRSDVRKIAAESGISEELAGRQVRYDFFERLCNEYSIERIATAHHKNDNAETILMNFMRGSGISGLCGIPYERGRIIRPLLDVRRDQIEKYCDENGLEYVTDETNMENIYTRNKIRHILIPEIEKLFNPSFIDTVTKNAVILNSDEDYLLQECENAYKSCVDGKKADTVKLGGLHNAILTRVIRKMVDETCGKADVPSSVINSIAEMVRKNITGGRIDVARGIYARIEYNRLIFDEYTEECADFEYELEIGAEKYIPELGYTVSVEKADVREKDGCEYFTVPDGALIKMRNRRGGDKFVPLGMKGTKKLKDFMIDEKIPRNDRSRVGILTIDENIAWIVGYRRDDRYKFKKNGIKIKIIY